MSKSRRGEPMIQQPAVEPSMTSSRRAFLRSLGKWSQVVISGVIGGGLLAPWPAARAVNWNDCPTNNHWLNSSGSGGHWVNSNDGDTRLQGGDSGDARNGNRPDRNWVNGNRDGWTNRQGCRGGTWVNY